MKEHTLHLRISAELKKQFEQLAIKRGMSISEYIRFMILQEIDKNK